MTLPLYPGARKRLDDRSETTSGSGQKWGHRIMVLDTTEPLEKVRAFYRSQLKPNIVMDQGEGAQRVITMTVAPAGGASLDYASTVVLQAQERGGVQITLSVYAQKP